MKIVLLNNLPCVLDEKFSVVEDTIWFVAYDDDDKIMGYAGIQFNWLDMVDIYISPCFIFPEYRGKGLQRKLLEVREIWAKKNGYTVLTSCAEPDNIYSINNLLAMGYKETVRYEESKQIWYEKKL